MLFSFRYLLGTLMGAIDGSTEDYVGFSLKALQR